MADVYPQRPEGAGIDIPERPTVASARPSRSPGRPDVQAGSGWSRRRRMLVAGGVAGASLLVAVAALLVFGGHRGSVNPGEAPLIKAEDRPFKVTPESPGGMEVPNRDIMVYGRLQGKPGGKPPVERLLPDPEQPLTPPASKPRSEALATAEAPMPSMPAGARPDAVPAAPTLIEPEAPQAVPASPVISHGHPAAETPASELAVQQKTAEKAAAEKVAAERAAQQKAAAEKAAADKAAQQKAAQQKVAAENAAADKTAAQKAAADKAAAQKAAADKAAAQKAAADKLARAEPTSAAPAASGGYLIQLYSGRSSDEAKGAWTQLKGKNGDLLASLSPSVARADLGDRGTFYRLRAGPLSEGQAKVLCQSLSGRGAPCIIVRPGT